MCRRRLSPIELGALGLVGVGAVVVLAVGALEVASRLASRSLARSPREVPPGLVEAVVVLGCPSRIDGTPSRMQRHRVRIGVRSRDARAARSVMIFTGRTARRVRAIGAHNEADVMARYATRALGVDPADVLIEAESTSTRENVAHTLPMLRACRAERIVLASTPFHALRARALLRALDRDLGSRLSRADDVRCGEQLELRAFDAVYELRRSVYVAFVRRGRPGTR